ncbi:MAG TPA: YXWGXW repeat-containing protein, partial [Verrucomicrobiae bacterium]|nr:YXWGXW repeat-containing protein [Verrucomicrobiae bacterium]
LIGQSMDRAQQERLRAQAPQTYSRVDQGQPLTISDIKALVRAGVSDDVIISQIKNSNTAFHLSANDIIDLHDSGVSDRVIDYMINTANSAAAAPPPVTQAPPPPPVQTVVVAPGPDYLWIDGEWEWGGATWIWAPGRWVLPPRPGVFWVHGYWYRGPGGGWHHHSGHWR